MIFENCKEVQKPKNISNNNFYLRFLDSRVSFPKVEKELQCHYFIFMCIINRYTLKKIGHWCGLSEKKNIPFIGNLRLLIEHLALAWVLIMLNIDIILCYLQSTFMSTVKFNLQSKKFRIILLQRNKCLQSYSIYFHHKS